MTDCIFCKIIAGEIPSKKVFENDRIYAFEDINPQAPTHILIIPKKHIPTINDIQTEDQDLVGELFIVAKKLANEMGLSESGYRVAMNCNGDAGQVVYHIHLHLVGGRALGNFSN